MRAAAVRQHGLSLVELMVSVAISVGLVSSLVYVYVGSRGAYRANEALARVQESGRFALEWIARDLRQAGYMGCLSRNLPITMHAFPPPSALPALGSAVYGFEKATTKTGPEYVFSPPSAAVTHVAGDVLLLFSLDDRTVAYVDSDHDAGVPANTKVAFSACPGFGKGETLMVTNCERAAIFSVTNDPLCKGGTSVLSHATGTKVAGNGWPKGTPCPYTQVSCSEGLGFEPPYQKSDRAIVARFSQRGYFVGRSAKLADRAPALYRFDSAGATETVAENVEDLDFLFGVDTDGDGSVDAYLKADAVTEGGQWGRVVSVRVSLIVASGELTVQAARGDKSAIAPGQVIYFRDEKDDDAVVDAAPASKDRQLRQVFTTTVALRNRLP
jgi:type IV pilus assembly protein PilW